MLCVTCHTLDDLEFRHALAVRVGGRGRRVLAHDSGRRPPLLLFDGLLLVREVGPGEDGEVGGLIS